MALLTLLISILAFPAAIIIWTAQSLWQNREKAKATGLPYLVRWISPINPFWLLRGNSFVRLCKRLGIATENLERIYPYGWEANERARIHVEHGDVFWLVYPSGLQLCVADAELAYEILQRRTDFRRNMEDFAVLNVYGKNLSTVDDNEWQRHRKMTAVTFTEKNNELVWQQSWEQAKGMLEYWTQRAKQPIRDTHEDTKIFTLNVIAAALFNKLYSFEGHAEQDLNRHTEDESYQYRESLSTILSGIIEIFICGEQGLKAWWTPKSWKRAGDAMATFRSYILALMNEERANIANGNDDNRHLVARLVRACQEDDTDTNAGTKADGEKNSKKITLTEQEILSNLFVYAFAGNDTTAVAMTNLLYHLAANPESQDWIAEEINYYISSDDLTSPRYDLLPKLKRCGAVIMESLRICHPLSQLVKTTNSTPQPLKIKGTTYMIPAGASVHCSLPALHTLPRYWGPTAMQWDPHRFVSTPGKASATPPFEDEVLAADTSEHFMPWAWGQRVCPGKRFSQAELVAALAALFKEWKVEPVPEKGESLDQARRRTWEATLVIDHEGHILHEMQDPESVGLRWIKTGP